jgi:hypothetical protein
MISLMLPAQRTTTTTEDTSETDITTTEQDTSTAFSRVPPQTRAPVLAEAEALLSRIQADTAQHRRRQQRRHRCSSTWR